MVRRKVTFLFTMVVMVAGGMNSCYQAKSTGPVAQDTATAQSRADAVVDDR